MNHIKLKRTLATYWPKKIGPRKIILLYHTIGDHPWGVSTKLFKMQMDWLNDHTSVMALDKLIDSSMTNQIQVALTFDDGYATLYDQALPILDNHNMHALCYINTGSIETDNRKISSIKTGHYDGEYFLSWKEIITLYQQQWTIGSHTVNHANLSTITPQLMKNELVISKNEIEFNLKTQCNHFAYPWGRYTKNTIQMLQHTGYKYAVTSQHGTIDNHTHFLTLPRINISNNYSFDDFKQIIIGQWDYLKIFHKMKNIIP